MMTRREKLLIRPWQLRRYNNHKKKGAATIRHHTKNWPVPWENSALVYEIKLSCIFQVISAVPLIDFGPPSPRKHVTVKLKKLQKERERQMKIEEDNFKLLQNLGSIMNKKRVDNFWDTKPPTFLRRVGIYHRTRTPTPCQEATRTNTPETRSTRKSKCLACTPHGEDPPLLPEERIPWKPPKKILTKRQSASGLVPITSDFDFPRVKNLKTPQKCLQVKPTEKKKPEKTPKLPSLISEKNVVRTEEAGQRVVVSQGSIQITVNFPSFAEVKFVQGKTEKYLQGFCTCGSFRPKKKNKTKLSARNKINICEEVD